ncbi:MAG: DUF362 domain-containing protein [Promethearchaeota archaeon]
MLVKAKSKKPDVVISKGITPRKCLIRGIEQLGGISRFIDKGDQVFIKFNLSLPGGFPNNTNLDLLDSLIIICKDAGVNKISLGSFPLKGIPIKIISDLLDLNEHFKSLGAELAFLDNSDYFGNKEINQDQLKKIKYNSFTKTQINNNEFLVPNIILNSNKFICVNQVNVDPLFKLNLSLLNLNSIIPPRHPVIGKMEKENLSSTPYKKDLISNILDVYMIRQPNLVINDLFYILEAAGPYLYKDSNLKRTNLMILGDNAIAVDVITLKMLNLEANDSELIIQAQNRNINVPKFPDIKIIGEKVENIQTNVELCVSKLEDIKVRNFSIHSGKDCSGCFKQAYHLLNFMKTYMGKDLKYNHNNSFLIGEKPTETEKIGNVILFGDCAINSTKNYKFRKIIIEPKEKPTRVAKKKKIKEQKLRKKIKLKEKQNKNILELPGCPPYTFNCLELILKYYGKKDVPNLNLFEQLNKFWINGELNDRLKDWEVI